MTIDLNDVILDLGGVDRILEPLALGASDAAIQAHLNTNVVGVNKPTLAQVKANIAVYQAKVTAAQGRGPTQFSSLEFLDKFTSAEQLAVVAATLQSAAVKLWYDKMLAASFVDLEDPRTADGLTALVGAGLITSARKTQILGL